MIQPTLPHADMVLTLALAVVTSSAAPTLLVDRAMTLLGASDTFYEVFHLDPAGTIGRSVYELDGGRWGVPRLRSVLGATLTAAAAIDPYEIGLHTREHGMRTLILKAQKLDYARTGGTLILLSIADVTDARVAEKLKDDLIREKDNLIREKAVLLQEIQHRVANSLQIIASVLMQSARNVQSDEARGHLRDAHHRVMSIASVQKQLSVSNAEKVELGPYLTQLCQSIGASMIRDHGQLALTVTVDKTAVTANVSISLGLIVTELVINALKHAFPPGRHGTIAVDFAATGLSWTLEVTDDGVGMPVKPDVATSGLGTSIVHALAKQLQARIEVADAKPGTKVAVIHAQLVAVNDEGNVPTEVAV